MSDNFKLTGRYSITPPTVNLNSGGFNISAEITQSFAVETTHAQVISLAANTEEDVDFGDVVEASLIILVSDKPVTLAITSDLGVDQLISGTFLILVNDGGEPWTGLALTAGEAATVRLTLGQV